MVTVSVMPVSGIYTFAAWRNPSPFIIKLWSYPDVISSCPPWFISRPILLYSRKSKGVESTAVISPVGLNIYPPGGVIIGVKTASQSSISRLGFEIGVVCKVNNRGLGRFWQDRLP